MLGAPSRRSELLEVARSLIQREDILDGGIRLNVVTRRDDVTRAGAPQRLEVVSHFGADIVRRAKGQGVLVVYPAVKA